MILSRKISAQSYAKLNLFLKVLGKRPDGFHDIFSVFQTVDLYDDISFSLEKGKSGITIRSTNLDIPTGEDNLISKAFLALSKIRDIPTDEGIVCSLKKKIPVGGGMAGGSSNCAVTLLAMNKLLDLNLTHEELTKIGESLGSDVPFFFTGGTCFIHGRGERSEVLAPLTEGAFLIVTPPISVNTAEAYAIIDKLREEQGISTETDSSATEMRDFYSRAILDGNFETFMHNDFEKPIFDKFPQIKDLKSRLERFGNVTLMTGSGSSVYTYFKNFDHAWQALEGFEPREGETVNIARPVSEGYLIYE